jgi:hypothetical protein
MDRIEIVPSAGHKQIELHRNISETERKRLNQYVLNVKWLPEQIV